MSLDQAIIEWILDALPPGWEWAGRPIVALLLLFVLLAIIFAIWCAWGAATQLLRRRKNDHSP